MAAAVPAGSRPIRGLAWMGGALFAASLLYFLYAYQVRFARPAPELASTALALGWNLALFLGFGLHHSVFARSPVRRWVAAHTPPGTERVLFVWVASLLLIAVCALWKPVPGPALWAGSSPVWRWVLGAIQVSGGVLAVGSAAVVGIWELAGIEPQRAAADAQELRRAGPYRWVRHPIYSGWFLLVLAAWPMTMTQLTFALASGIYTLVGLTFEERSLHASTQGAYERYTAEVPWRLIPGIF